jgi:hypothetical protein
MKFHDLQLPKEKVGMFYDLTKELRHFTKKPVLGRCMFWSGNCDSSPIGSHLLARSWLEQIADEKNHVIQFEFSTKDIGNQPAQIIPKLIGINNATIFPGFCEKHDDQVFASLEKCTFTASQEQLLRLRYWRFPKESFGKKPHAS